MKKQIIIALATLTALPAVSQEKWDLRKCIDYAIEHNLSIKQQEAARDQNAVDLNTAKYSRLPNLNGNVGQSFNFGRALQADNTYGDRNTKNTNFSLSTSIPLFTGLRIPNNIALSKLNLKAAIEDLNKAKEDISISVTSAYLQILFNEELSKSSSQPSRVKPGTAGIERSLFQKMGKHLKPKSTKPAHVSPKTKCQQYRLTITIS